MRTVREASTVWTLKCRRAVQGGYCGEPASHVLVQGHELAMLFHDSATVYCAKHTREAEQWGALPLSLRAYAEAVECSCGSTGPDADGNYDQLEDPDCPRHGPAVPSSEKEN